MLEAGSIVILHLVQPNEKFWGRLESLDAIGIVLRGISVESFDEWMRQVAHGGEAVLGLATMFVPLFRIERIFVDEQVGAVESYRQRFERRVGVAVESVFAGDRPDGPAEVPS